jgi:hypothetical protein
MLREKGFSALYDPPDLGVLMDRLSEESKTTGEAAQTMVTEQSAEMVLGDLTPPEVRNDPQRLGRVISGTLRFARGEGAHLQLRNIETAMDPRLESEKKTILNLKAELSKQETIDKLLQATFLPETVSKDDITLRQRTEAMLKDLILKGEITVREAMDLYFWLNSPVGGQVLAGAKTISIIQKKDYELGNSLQVHVTETVENLVTSDPDKISTELEKLGLSPEQEREMRNVALYMKEDGADRMLSLSDKIYQFLEKYPWLLPIILPGFTLLALRTIAKTGKMIIRAPHAFKLGALAEFKDLRGTALKDFLSKHGIKGVGESVVREAQIEGQRLYQELQALRAQDRWWRSRPFFAQGKVLHTSDVVIRAARTGELDDLAKAMAKIYPTPHLLAERLAPIAGSWDTLEKSLIAAGHSAEEAMRAVSEVQQLADKNASEVVARRLSPLSIDERVRIAQGVIESPQWRTDPRLKGIINQVHNHRLTELNQLYAQLGQAGEKKSQETIQKQIYKILFEKRNLLEQAGLPHSDANKLVRTGVCGLEGEEILQNIDRMNQGLRINPTDEAKTLKALGLKEPGLQVVEEGDEANKLLRVVDQEGKTVKTLKVRPLGPKVVAGGFVILDVGMVVLDVIEYVDAAELKEKTTNSIRAAILETDAFKHLTDAQKNEEKYRKFQGKEAFVYNGNPDVVISIDDLTAGLENKKDYATTKIVVDSAALTTSALALAGTGVGLPAALVVAGLSVTVHTVSAGMERADAFKALKVLPSWLLARIGPESFGVDTEVLDKSIFDAFRSGSGIEGTEVEARSRLLFALWSREVQKRNPDLYREITPPLTPQEGDQFFEEDFRRVILPFLKAELFTASSTMKWKDIDRNLSIEMSEAMKKYGLGQALYKSALLYKNHLEEKRYLELRNLAERLKDTPHFASEIPRFEQDQAALVRLGLLQSTDAELMKRLKEGGVLSEEEKQDLAAKGRQALTELLRITGEKFIAGKKLVDLPTPPGWNGTGRPETRFDVAMRALPKALTAKTNGGKDTFGDVAGRTGITDQQRKDAARDEEQLKKEANAKVLGVIESDMQKEIAADMAKGRPPVSGEFLRPGAGGIMGNVLRGNSQGAVNRAVEKRADAAASAAKAMIHEAEGKYRVQNARLLTLPGFENVTLDNLMTDHIDVDPLKKDKPFVIKRAGDRQTFRVTQPGYAYCEIHVDGSCSPGKVLDQNNTCTIYNTAFVGRKSDDSTKVRQLFFWKHGEDIAKTGYVVTIEE